MNEFEEKLQAYRAQEKRKHQIEQLQNIILKPAKFFRSETKSSFEIIDDKKEVSVPDEDLYKNVNSECTSNTGTIDIEESSFSWKRFLLDFFIWIAFFRFAVYIEFGAVFLLLSGFYLIWKNTRTGPKRADEMSAYSVFNPNCERIEGTLDAEQFEKEIRYGMII